MTLPRVFRVRTSVTENFLSVGQLETMGITPASVAASLSTNARGWVAVDDGRVAAFVIADLASRSIFALFVLSEYEGRGLGSCLLERAQRWLQSDGTGVMWLRTARDTRAAGFYRRRGWVIAGTEPDGSLRLVKYPDATNFPSAMVGWPESN
jgi:GNAT superfamily N-acetyltransferase